jgi:hypothetical protein
MRKTDKTYLSGQGFDHDTEFDWDGPYASDPDYDPDDQMSLFDDDDDFQKYDDDLFEDDLMSEEE